MKKDKIKKLKAREILDSRGNPTVEVLLETESGFFRDSVPSGASTGKYEAVELRDGKKSYLGKGVALAVENVNKIIALKIKGKDPVCQKEIDDLMIKIDGTENKSKLGANAILAVSLAVCRAGAKKNKLELFEYIRRIFESKNKKEKKSDFKIPFPSFNIINGGAHAGNNLDFQEFMVVPREGVFLNNLRIGAEIYQQLRKIIIKRYGRIAANLGDEGGFAPDIFSPEQALNLIISATKELNYEKKIRIILDVAATQFYKEGRYKMKIGIFTREGLTNYYANLLSKYPIIGIEDPFSEDDWEGFKDITKKFGKKILIIGDDLLATNPERIQKAKEKKAANAMILKINQIGTISEALEAAALAKKFGWKIIVSHRSGETNDDFIADFAVGISADFIKTGAPARGERVVKYNRLLEIEEKIK